jgi:hypothetical protein
MENTFNNNAQSGDGGGGDDGFGFGSGGGGGSEGESTAVSDIMPSMEGLVPTLPSLEPNISAAFSDSNSLVSMVSFILLVFFVFIIVMKFGIQIITSFFNPSQVVIINGMVNGQTQIDIPSNPNLPGAINLPRSNNSPDGIEFTYSVWLFIENSNGTSGSSSTCTAGEHQYNHIFSKGNSILLPTPSVDVSMLHIPHHNYVMNAPGLYYKPGSNELVVLMNTFSTIYENIQISNVPLNKWFNVIIRCENKMLDVFINGNITQSIELLGVPRQNYGEIHVGLNNGFNGYLSNLTYYSYSLGTKGITDVVSFGPNTRASSLNSVSNSYNQYFNNSNYLSTRWYFGGVGDMYNPTSSQTAAYTKAFGI